MNGRHGTAAPESPDHLVFRPLRRLAGFDVTSCPWRTPGAGRVPPIDRLLTQFDGEARLWRLDGRAAAPVLLHARAHHGQAWLATADAPPRALELAAPCRACHRLHECPSCFVPVADRRTLRPPEPPHRPVGRTHRRDGRFLRGTAPDLARYVEFVARQAQDGDAVLEEPVREVWLVERDAVLPPRPPPSDPAPLLRALRERAVVARSYTIPSPDRRAAFRAVVGAAGRIADRLVARRHAGTSLQITESCMCRCLMCNLVGYFKRPQMPLPEVLRAMEEAALLGVELLDLFGGEVTLRRDLFELIRHARWLGLQCMFITTGYYVTPAYARRLEQAGLNRVVVSLDGSRPEIHDSIRQLPGLFAKAVRALKALAARPNIETFASTVILSQNLHDLPALVRLSGRLGIRGHEFFLPISGPVASTVPRWPTRAQAEELLERIVPAVEREAERLGVHVDFRPEVRAWNVPRRRAVALISSGRYHTRRSGTADRCPSAGWNLFVTVTGDVYPCDIPSLIRPRGALGNLRDATLLEIATSSAMARFDRDAGCHAGCRMCVGRYEAVRPDADRKTERPAGRSPPPRAPGSRAASTGPGASFPRHVRR